MGVERIHGWSFPQRAKLVGLDAPSGEVVFQSCSACHQSWVSAENEVPPMGPCLAPWWVD